MRSFMSAFAAFAIRCSGWKRRAADPVWRGRYFEKLAQKSAKPYRMAPFLHRTKIEKQIAHGVEVFSFNKGKENKILYLPGGSFCEQPRVLHAACCDRIAAKTDFEILFPIHPKAPAHTFEETFLFLERFYRHLLTETKPEHIVLMGDSSGGGLALSFCEYLKSVSLPQPARLVLLSPVLDCAMEAPFPPEFDRLDPSLQREFLQEACQNWAGETDVRDYRISPLYGDYTALAPITLFVGSYEAFVVDARRFRQRCEEAGVLLDYREYPGMNHVFVIYPIPEARKAQNEIIELLKKS